MKFFHFILLLGLVVIPVRAAPSLPVHISEETLGVEVLWQRFVETPPSQRPRVVLVLGGGGARGLSHIGVLRVLEQEKIPVDYIVGVSVGALIGALYASGISVDEIESMSNDVGWSTLTDYSRFRILKLILREELLSTSKMEHYLRQHIGNKYFTDLKIPFVCLATDLKSGQKVVFKEGAVALAARASATIPGVFKPVLYRQRQLVDGGLVDNLPTNLIATDENDFVLAVLPRADEERENINSVLKTLVRSMEIQKDSLMNEKKKDADFLIEPQVGTISMADLDRSKECIDAGLLAARVSAKDLKKEILRRMSRKAPQAVGVSSLEKGDAR